MPKFEVRNTASGHSFGVYEAETAEQAIEACCRDAGYASRAHADEVTGRDDDLVAVEVTDPS